MEPNSGLCLIGVLQLTLKYAKLNFLKGFGWNSLPEYLEKKKAIVNIKNNDNRSFGYALLYFLERKNLPKKNLQRPSYYTQQMFVDHNLHEIDYPISPNDVHRYEDQCQININLFTFFDFEGRNCYPLYISQKNYPRKADLLYWDEHYAPISNFNRLFRDITKSNHQHHLCIRCLKYFKNTEILACHKQQCTGGGFIFTLDMLLPAPELANAARAGCTTQGDYIGNGERTATAGVTKHRGCPFDTTSAHASTLGKRKRFDYGATQKASRVNKVKSSLFKDASIVGTKDDNYDDGNDNDNDNDFVVERCK